jgi:hypothetical protein
MSNEHSAGKDANLAKALEYLRANKHWLKSDLERTIALNVCMGILEQHLSQEPQQTGWVSVKDRLPEPGVYVLTTHENVSRIANFPSGIVAYYSKVRECFLNWHDDEPDIVTHWQPLPAPPQQPIHSPENKEK